MPEPLRLFLDSSLAADPTDLDEGEIISDAMVIYRISKVADDEDGSLNGISERYNYTVTPGMNLAMAYGMMQITLETLGNYYWACLNQEEDD